MSIIGNNIRKLRESKNMSQREFALFMNTTRGKIDTYENDRAEPKQVFLQQLCDRFSLSLDDLSDPGFVVPHLNGKSVDELKVLKDRIRILEDSLRDKDKIIALLEKMTGQ